MAMSASFFNTMSSPTLHSTGVGRRRSRRDGALAGDRPETGGGPRDGTRKAWPLLVSAGSHSLSVQFESNAGGHAGASGGCGCRETSPVCERWNVIDGNGRSFIFRGDNEKVFDN